MKWLPTILLGTSLVSSGVVIAHDTSSSPAVESTHIQITKAQLDSLLAPIALYPDTLLTQVLMASTYPIDIVQAARWRKQNPNVAPEDIPDLLEDVDWDPSVKALVAFDDILFNMSDDLLWTEQLGQLVDEDEEALLERVQYLRKQAYIAGQLQDNDYQTVQQTNQQVIVITPRQPKVIHVPYYDPYVAYGAWHHRYDPVVWHRPHRTKWHAGIYWGSGIRFGVNFLLGDVHWHNRHIVYYRNPVHLHNRRVIYRQHAPHTYRHWRPTTRTRVYSAPKYHPARKVVHSREYGTSGKHIQRDVYRRGNHVVKRTTVQTPRGSTKVVRQVNHNTKYSNKPTVRKPVTNTYRATKSYSRGGSAHHTKTVKVRTKHRDE